MAVSKSLGDENPFPTRFDLAITLRIVMILGSGATPDGGANRVTELLTQQGHQWCHPLRSFEVDFVFHISPASTLNG